MKCDRKTLCLYGVTAEGIEELTRAVEEAISGGVTAIQFREKNIADAEFYQKAKELCEVAHRHGVPFLVNDRVDIAEKIGADGVHLGQGDMDIAVARRLLGEEKIIGATAHSVEEARVAEKMGADYLGVGALFPSATKGDTVALSVEELRRITASVCIPVIAIGGISEENIHLLRGSGISGVAVVSALFGKENVCAVARTLRERAEEVIKENL